MHVDPKCIFHGNAYNKSFPTTVSIVIVIRMKYAVTTAVLVNTMDINGSLLFLLLWRISITAGRRFSGSDIR